MEKLTADNARLEEQLADSKSTNHQARSDEHVAGLGEDFRKFHEENSHLKKELDTATENVEKLTADNARLEEELAESKKTVDQRYSNEYVADLLGGMEQLQNELSSSQPSPQVKDAEIRELAFENSRLKEELSIACENLGLSPFSSCRHSLTEDVKARIERMLDEEPRASDSDAGAKASTSNNNKTFAKDTYGTLYTIPKTNGNDYDWIQDVDVDFLELDNSDAESWCMGDPTPTSRSQNTPKESDVDAM